VNRGHRIATQDGITDVGTVPLEPYSPQFSIPTTPEVYGSSLLRTSQNRILPWSGPSQILTIIIADQFSPAIRQEARKIGFTGETERE
jgi:hypothetical protein